MTIYDFKKGDLVRITKRPMCFSSKYGSDIRDSVTYPFEATIDDISDDNEHCLIKNGGWSLIYLVDDDCIEFVRNKEEEPLFIN